MHSRTKTTVRIKRFYCTCEDFPRLHFIFFSPPKRLLLCYVVCRWEMWMRLKFHDIGRVKLPSVCGVIWHFIVHLKGLLNKLRLWYFPGVKKRRSSYQILARICNSPLGLVCNISSFVSFQIIFWCCCSWQIDYRCTMFWWSFLLGQQLVEYIGCHRFKTATNGESIW